MKMMDVLSSHGNIATHVISFSGGRTSAHLVYLAEDARRHGADIRYVFMDTGAEHPKTYEFIREVVKRWKINLVCLRVQVNPELGEANSYKIIHIDDIGPDLQPWIDITKKYGTPYFGGAFCTRTMKIEVCERYIADHCPGAVTWMGIRADEPRRIWGERLYPLLRRMGFSELSVLDLYKEIREYKSVETMIDMLESRYLIDTHNAQRLASRIIKQQMLNQRVMAEITDFTKDDVLSWWAGQSFDLEISEHLGNCVFCIKKGLNKVALALRDEPELARQFKAVIFSDSVRVVARRQQENKIMYRKSHSIESVERLYSVFSREEIAATVKGSGGYETGSCGESCEPFITDDDQLELFR